MEEGAGGGKEAALEGVETPLKRGDEGAGPEERTGAEEEERLIEGVTVREVVEGGRFLVTNAGALCVFVASLKVYIVEIFC